MGSVFRKAYTKPMPAGAECYRRGGVDRIRWVDRNGKRHDIEGRQTAGVDGSPRMLLESLTYVARYVPHGKKKPVEVSTGCRDEFNASRFLSDLEAREERKKVGIYTDAELSTAGHASTPIAPHLEEFVTHLVNGDTSAKYIANVRRLVEALAKECKFTTLKSLDAVKLGKWLRAKKEAGMSPATRNTYRAAIHSFAAWCVRSGFLSSNPFADVPKADERLDVRRKRRALTADEVGRLIDAARTRPVVEATTIRRGKRAGQRTTKLKPEARDRLEWQGRERALVYLTLVRTGLRRGELASLTVGSLHLGGVNPFARLKAGDEKNRKGSDVPLHADLVDELRAWLADKLRRTQAVERAAGRPVPKQLAPDMPLVFISSSSYDTFARDLAAAGIVSPDESGRVVDLHSLRHTFGTMLAQSGVHPRVAQKLMRHSKIDLTMNVYTDETALDTRGALDSLPSLPG